MTEKKTHSSTTKKVKDLSDEWDTVLVTPHDVILANSTFLEGILQYMIRQQGRCGHCGKHGHEIKNCKERNVNDR